MTTVPSVAQLTPDGKRAAAAAAAGDTINENTAAAATAAGGRPPKAIEEDFFDMLTKSQSKRMDDQRCSLKVLGRSATIDTPSTGPTVRKPLAQQNSLAATGVSSAPVGGAATTKQENRYVLLTRWVACKRAHSRGLRRVSAMPCSR